MERLSIKNKTSEKYKLYKAERKKVKELVEMFKKQKWKSKDKSKRNRIKNKKEENIAEVSELMKR